MHLSDVPFCFCGFIKGNAHFKYQFLIHEVCPLVVLFAEHRVNTPGEKLLFMLMKAPRHFGYHFWLSLRTQREILAPCIYEKYASFLSSCYLFCLLILYIQNYNSYVCFAPSMFFMYPIPYLYLYVGEVLKERVKSRKTKKK